MRRFIPKKPKFLLRRRYQAVTQTLNASVERVVKFWLRSTVVKLEQTHQTNQTNQTNQTKLSRAEQRRLRQQQLGIPQDRPLSDRPGDNVQLSLCPNYPTLTEKEIHSLSRDFLELYEMNSSVIQLVNISSYRVQDKTYVLSPQNDYSWYISSVDNHGKLSKYGVTPRQLGHSIEAMFGVVKNDKVLEPELLMALCRHYEMMWVN